MREQKPNNVPAIKEDRTKNVQPPAPPVNTPDRLRQEALAVHLSLFRTL